MKCSMRKMSPQQYGQWLKDPRSKDASLPSFFNKGVQRTKNILKGTATAKSITKWKSFKARHGTAYCEKPTYKRAIALRNWGFAVKIPKRR